jgi:RNA polymerase sigma-70 factor, ECF subfamily
MRSGADLQRVLSEVAKGDREAFRALYDATAPKLFGVVLRIIGNRAEAEEVLQEAYVQVWRKADLYRPEAGQPMAWLAAIARNRALDRIRAGRIDRARSDYDESILERIAAPEFSPSTRQSLRQCLGALEEDARRCVILAYCSGYSREELAEQFGRPVGTIKTLLHRTVKALRACLERE